MATYIQIGSNILSSSAATVTFSSISNAYTDLVLVMSAKSTDTTTATDGGIIRFNGGGAGNIYYTRYIQWTSGSAAPTSTSLGPDTDIWPLNVNSSNAAYTNVFNTAEIYIPNYTASTYKSLSFTTIAEQNNSSGYGLGTMGAGLWQSTSAISSITCYPPAGSWATYSSFYLYGIKKD